MGPFDDNFAIVNIIFGEVIDVFKHSRWMNHLIVSIKISAIISILDQFLKLLSFLLGNFEQFITVLLTNLFG